MVQIKQRPISIPDSTAFSPQAAALESELRSKIRGEVRFDSGSRALYATDASNYRQVPIGAVIPRDQQDVIETIAVCHRHRAPIVARGGGTSLAGQCCNVAVVMDMSKYYNAILDLDPEKRTARVQPGIVLDTLRDAAERYNLTFPPDPSTHNHCTLGGMIGNNSCGVHSVMGGKTSENLLGLDVVTYDGARFKVGPTSDEELARIIAEGGRQGQIYKALRDLIDRYADHIRARFPKIPRRVSGYALDELLPENGFNVARALTGSEGTCVTILEADLRLVHSPPSRVLVVLGYEDVFAAGDDVPEVLSFSPIGLEGMDGELVGYMQRKGLHPDDVALLPKGDGWLLAEFGGETPEEAKANAQKLMDRMKDRTSGPDVRLLEDPAQQSRIWLVRESGLGATAFVPGLKDAWEGWEDSAVAPDRLGDYLRSFRKLLDKYQYYCALYGHFGQGCVHVRIDFDLLSQPGIDHYRAFAEEAAENVVRFGGSLSGEHGDGQSRAELLPKMFGEEVVHAFEEFKSIWDPAGLMNPGKLVHPYRLDENLRLGTDYNPPDLKTHFTFEPSEGSFARAALRCVGVGECRRLDGGTMCPSYRATREEKHATRGRAHLLFEMLEADPLQGGWRSEEVKDALDLCLACKGCKGDCPVNVDMATYKAEFLSHYYERRLRPRSAYAFGLIPVWAKLLSNFAGVANVFTQTPFVSAAAKLVAGIDHRRKIPAFATKSFRRRFEAHRAITSARHGRVILWPDTFNNYFLPDAADAATEVLERLGFEVGLPPDGLCCGRPLYDFGMLDKAERYIQHIIESMRPEIRAGTPIVVLEPSCLAVFRDELPNLLPHDEDAKRLHSQTFLLAEFLADRAADRLPHLDRKAILHGHCHQKAIVGMRSDEAVLEAIGLDYELLDDGCCGMAGSFGFEAGEHCDVSLQVGELGILPAVRNASPDTLVIADGFSCRQQVSQVLGQMPLHLAQVLQMAFRQDDHR